MTIKVEVKKEFNLNLVSACCCFLDYMIVEANLAIDGNGGVDIKALNAMLLEVTKESFIKDVNDYVHEEWEEGEIDFDEEINYGDAIESNGFKEIYIYVSELFFKA